MTVTALLNFEGSNGSTTFTDTTSNQTWTRNATSCEIQTAQFRGGTSSLRVENSDYVSATLATALSGTFHVEGWFYFTFADWLNDATPRTLFELDGSAVRHRPSDGTVTYWNGANFATGFTNTFPAYDSWVHVALVRNSSNNYQIWVNGIAGTLSTWASTTSYSNIRIGSNINPYGYSGYVGWVDGFRIHDTDQIFFWNNASGPEINPTTTPVIRDVSNAGVVVPSDFVFTDRIRPDVLIPQSTDGVVIVPTGDITVGGGGSSTPTQVWG